MKNNVTLLLTGGKSSRVWPGSRRALVRVHNLSMLESALDIGLRDLGMEVKDIVLDRVATNGEFLHLLSALPADFRGDVLLIESDTRAFLCSVLPGQDGRKLYELDTSAIDFYVHARFGDAVSETITRSDNAGDSNPGPAFAAAREVGSAGLQMRASALPS